MLSINYLAIFSTLLLSASAVSSSPALDGPAPVSGIWARNPLLAFRDNIVYCGETGGTTYCTDSVCCGTINCMPADAECCTNGQYCLSGTTCTLVGSSMECYNPEGSSAGSPGSKTAPSKNNAGRLANGASAALGVAGVVGLLL